MPRFPLALLALALCGTVAVAEDKKELPKELLPFQGTWEIEALTGFDQLKGQWPAFLFEGETLTIAMPMKGRREASTISVAPDKKPGEMDIQPKKQFEKSVKAIYKFEKEKLVLCFALEGVDAERPKEFKGEKPYALFVLVKAKEKK